MIQAQRRRGHAAHVNSCSCTLFGLLVRLLSGLAMRQDGRRGHRIHPRVNNRIDKLIAWRQTQVTVDLDQVRRLALAATHNGAELNRRDQRSTAAGPTAIVLTPQNSHACRLPPCNKGRRLPEYKLLQLGREDEPERAMRPMGAKVVCLKRPRARINQLAAEDDVVEHAGNHVFHKRPDSKADAPRGHPCASATTSLKLGQPEAPSNPRLHTCTIQPLPTGRAHLTVPARDTFSIAHIGVNHMGVGNRMSATKCVAVAFQRAEQLPPPAVSAGSGNARQPRLPHRVWVATHTTTNNAKPLRQDKLRVHARAGPST